MESDVPGTSSCGALQYSNAATAATSAAPVPVDRPSNGSWIFCPHECRIRVPCNVIAPQVATSSLPGSADRRAQGSGREGQPPSGAAWLHGSGQPPQLTMQSGYRQLSYDFIDVLAMSSLEHPCRRANQHMQIDMSGRGLDWCSVSTTHAAQRMSADEPLRRCSCCQPCTIRRDLWKVQQR